MSKTVLLGYISFILLLLIQPGFNALQQLEFKLGEPTVRALPLELPSSVVLPVLKKGIQPPGLSAKAYLVLDRNSGSELAVKEPETKLYPASITKIMTALVAREAFDMSQIIEIEEESEAIGNTMKLQRGEKITVENLFKGLLISSGNDAAYAFATAYPGGYDAFIQRMNEKAKEFHMNNTTYLNVSGVEQEGHLTTVRDLGILVREAMKDDFFRLIVATQRATVSDVSGTIVHDLYTTNQLLGVIPGMEGIKTGWTTQAGECLITQTTRDGHTIITVVLGSNDRFGETASLIRWAFGGHEWNQFKVEESLH